MKKTRVDGSLNFPQQWFWNKGSLTTDIDGFREFPYLHFLPWKKKAWPSIPPKPLEYYQELIKEDRWSIDAKGFHPIKAV